MENNGTVFYVNKVFFCGPMEDVYNAIGDYWKLKVLNDDVPFLNVYSNHRPKDFNSETIRELINNPVFNDLKIA